MIVTGIEYEPGAIKLLSVNGVVKLPPPLSVKFTAAPPPMLVKLPTTTTPVLAGVRDEVTFVVKTMPAPGVAGFGAAVASPAGAGVAAHGEPLTGVKRRDVFANAA